MEKLFIILFIVMPLTGIFIVWFLRKEKGVRSRAYIRPTGERVLLTKKDIAEMSRKNYGSHSWFTKTKAKHK